MAQGELRFEPKELLLLRVTLKNDSGINGGELKASITGDRFCQAPSVHWGQVDRVPRGKQMRNKKRRDVGRHS